MGKLECSRSVANVQGRILFQLYTSGWKIDRLPSHSEQNTLFYWNSVNELTVILNELTSWVKTQNFMQPPSSDFLSPAGRHPKYPVCALHSHRQPVKSDLPHWLSSPFLIIECSFWREGTRECHQFGFLNERLVWPGTRYRQHRGDNQEAIVCMVMAEHRTTAGRQNELAGILFPLLLCHLASS